GSLKRLTRETGPLSPDLDNTSVGKCREDFTSRYTVYDCIPAGCSSFIPDFDGGTFKTAEHRTARAQFTPSPMIGDFVDIILGALDETDTGNVETETDNVSTEIRGSIENTFDVMQSIFLHAAKAGEHVALSGTAAIGCPGSS